MEIHNHISMTASLLAASQYIGNKLITIVAHRWPFYPRTHLSQLSLSLSLSLFPLLCPRFLFTLVYRSCLPLCSSVRLCSPYSFAAAISRTFAFPLSPLNLAIVLPRLTFFHHHSPLFSPSLLAHASRLLFTRCSIFLNLYRRNNGGRCVEFP